MKMNKLGMLAAASLLWSVAGSQAQAPQGPDGWQLEITPYAWLAGLEGDVTVNGQEADFEKSFSDIVDAVELGGSLLAIAQYDRILIWGQVDYFSMSTDEMDVEDQPAGGTLDSKLLLGEVAVGYQLDGWMDGQTFDFLVGARTLHMENDLALKDGRAASRENDLVDPIFVMRPSIPVLPSKIDGLRFNPTLAVGAGGDADLVYEMMPQFQYEISDTIAARLGYRTVGYKFKGDNNDENELNINLSGLFVGLGIKL